MAVLGVFAREQPVLAWSSCATTLTSHSVLKLFFWARLSNHTPRCRVLENAIAVATGGGFCQGARVTKVHGENSLSADVYGIRIINAIAPDSCPWCTCFNFGYTPRNFPSALNDGTELRRTVGWPKTEVYGPKVLHDRYERTVNYSKFAS